MNCGTAKARDLPALRSLWMRCFGDGEDYVNLYFEHAFRPERVFVLRAEDGQPAAMAIAFPVSLRAGSLLPGAYLYAVCTAPEARGRGCFRRLTAYAEQQLAGAGCAFVCLKPASEALARTYGRMGYEPCFTNRSFPTEASKDYVNVTPLSAADYGCRRRALLEGAWVDYPDETLAHQARLGTLFAADSGGLRGLGAAECWGDRLVLKEYLGDEALLGGICAHFGAARMSVRTPGLDAPFAMARPLGAAPLPANAYLGLAFD